MDPNVRAFLNMQAVVSGIILPDERKVSSCNGTSRGGPNAKCFVEAQTLKCE
jgi:hypothetical protein